MTTRTVFSIIFIVQRLLIEEEWNSPSIPFLLNNNIKIVILSFSSQTLLSSGMINYTLEKMFSFSLKNVLPFVFFRFFSHIWKWQDKRSCWEEPSVTSNTKLFCCKLSHGSRLPWCKQYININIHMYQNKISTNLKSTIFATPVKKSFHKNQRSKYILLE